MAQAETFDSITLRDAGRTAAIATRVQRDLLRCAQTYPDLFPARPFDPVFVSSIGLANTICAPGASATQLRMATRITMWIFGVDRLMDLVAATRAEVDDVTARCLAAASGDPSADRDPGADRDPSADRDALGAFLVEIRAELATYPAWQALAPVWHEELRGMLASMTRDWVWHDARKADPSAPMPSLDDYLDQAEFGFALVYVSHWIAISGDEPVSDVAELVEAGRQVQRVIRILNDLGTYRRDLEWGDVNVLLLGATDAEVNQHLAELVQHCRRLIEGLRGAHGSLAAFLSAMIEFNVGFYAVGDYWGEL